MKVNHNKIFELSDSWINGNIGWVKDKAKRLNRVEFVLLCSEIVNRQDNIDIDQIAFKLTDQ